MIKDSKIICICGSTRFTIQMLKEKWELERRGVIVLDWAYNPLGFTSEWVELNHNQADEEGIRELLDYTHKHKIDLADEVLIINVNGYIGNGTKSEIKYARSTNKPVLFLEPLSIEQKIKIDLATLPDNRRIKDSRMMD
jgi:hypothetical protein